MQPGKQYLTFLFCEHAEKGAPDKSNIFNAHKGSSFYREPFEYGLGIKSDSTVVSDMYRIFLLIISTKCLLHN